MGGLNPTTPASESDHSRLVGLAGAVAVLLVIIGLFTYSANKETDEAQQKAAELTQKLEAAGLRTPADQDVFVRTLGSDGGAVCDNPGESLGKAVLFDQLTNGGSFVGRRPVIVDRKVLLGEFLILQTYCPDEVQEYKEDILDELKVDDVIKDG